MQRSGILRARRLRRSMTDAERTLWNAVRDRRCGGHKIRRQWPIGPYVADFACVETKLVIEIDGGQHADNAADLVRTRALEAAGYTVVRFWNTEVLTNLDGVLAVLLNRLNTPAPP